MKIAIITADQPRHKYFANAICEHFGDSVCRVVSEVKFYDPHNEEIQHRYRGESEEDIALWDWHFSLRDEMEEKYFGFHKDFSIGKEKLTSIPAGSLNSKEVISQFKNDAPDVMAVFGSGILKKELIQIPPKGIINCHLGLSPYYRGSGTNFWPLYNGEPEYVGVTIHYLDEGIDSGVIIKQGRPDIVIGDNQHDIGNKTIQVGVKCMVEVLERFAQGEEVVGVTQSDEGKLYTRRDFSAVSIKVLKGKLESGLVEEYLKCKDERCAKAPIIE
jgi:folate-dependent phosphoribosylglycinamide formyltransferase PurN